MITYHPEVLVAMRIDATGIIVHNGRPEAIVITVFVNGRALTLFSGVLAASETMYWYQHMDEEMQKAVTAVVETREMAQERAPLCEVCGQKKTVDHWPHPELYWCPTCAENETDFDDCEDETDWED